MVDSDRGLFVVFEGGDGVGKSTQQALLAQRLAGAGIPHVVTRQPGGTAVGDRIREILLDPDNAEVAPRAEALLYAADKVQHIEQVIAPALAQRQIVVCDRYLDSLLAYQGAGRELAGDDLAWLARWASGGLRPDITVLLDLDPAVAIADKADPDRIESAGVDFHQRVRQQFLALAAANSECYLVLAAREAPERIADQVWHRVRPLLPRSPGEVSDVAGKLDP